MVMPVSQLQAIKGRPLARPAATLPATTHTPYFTIAGGRVILTALVGEVTTVIQAQANAVKLISTPTVGTAVDLCGTVDINGKEVGCLLGITGLPSDAMVATNAGLTPVMYRRLIIPIGTIDFSTAATSTGATKWLVMWLPYDDGATLVLA